LSVFRKGLSRFFDFPDLRELGELAQPEREVCEQFVQFAYFPGIVGADEQFGMCCGSH
jgi:hypothetical protein